MERLEKESAGRVKRLAWLSTHPVTAERVARARETAKK